MWSIAVVIVLVAVVGLWLAATYNSLVRHRNLVAEGWSGIDVQLKRRADLIPNLVETVKGYMDHEQEVFKRVTELRSKSLQTQDVEEKSRVEGMLSRALGNLFAVAENYPELKANQNFIDLQGRLSEIEEQIQMSRRYYNGTARNLNIVIESFPSNLVAQVFNFRQAPYFEIEEPAERSTPKVEF